MKGYNLPDSTGPNDPDAPWNQEDDMGDDESRREDARIEVMIERALRNGSMATCHACGNEDWVEYGAFDDERIPLCRPCMKEHQARY
jgi:hypothetical protein